MQDTQLDREGFFLNYSITNDELRELLTLAHQININEATLI